MFSLEEMKYFFLEYCEELVNMEIFKCDGKVVYEGVYKEWVKKYVNDKGQFIFYRVREVGENDMKCEVCGGSGYKGWVGLHELMVGIDGVKKLIQEYACVV